MWIVQIDILKGTPYIAELTLIETLLWYIGVSRFEQHLNRKKKERIFIKIKF